MQEASFKREGVVLILWGSCLIFYNQVDLYRLVVGWGG